jgi:hypothetical protein
MTPPKRLRRPCNITLSDQVREAAEGLATRLDVPFGRLAETALRAELARHGIELLELAGTAAAVDRLIRDARQWQSPAPKVAASASKPQLAPELAAKASAAAALLSKMEVAALRSAEMTIEEVLARVAAKASSKTDLQKVWRHGQYGYATIYLAVLARAHVIRMDRETKRWTLGAAPEASTRPPAAGSKPFVVPAGARVFNALPPPAGAPRGAAPPSRRRPRSSTSSS